MLSGLTHLTAASIKDLFLHGLTYFAYMIKSVKDFTNIWQNPNFLTSTQFGCLPKVSAVLLMLKFKQRFSLQMTPFPMTPGSSISDYSTLE